MGPDDPCAASRRYQMGCDRTAEALLRLGRRDRTDETFARCADQYWKAENTEFFQPGQRHHALFLRLAKADAGIEHDIAGRNARFAGDVERAGKERSDILHDIDGSVRAVAVVHDNDRTTACGYQ